MGRGRDGVVRVPGRGWWAPAGGAESGRTADKVTIRRGQSMSGVMEGFLFAPEWGWRPLKGWVTSWYDEAEDCKGSSVYCVENMPTAGHLAEQQAVVVFWWGACGEGGKVTECLLKPSLHCKHASQRVPGACSIFKDLPALCVHAHVCAKSLQSCLTLRDPMNCTPPGFSVHGTLQARILKGVAMPSSRGTSWPRDQTLTCCGSCIAGRFFTPEPQGTPTCSVTKSKFLNLLNLHC